MTPLGAGLRARVWKEDGCWHWDARDTRPGQPAMRSTGDSAEWRDALGSALAEMAWMASLPS